MQTVGALPPGNAFPAPHKPECAKLRKKNDRFADLPGSSPNRFADLSTDNDASIAWRPKRFAPMQRHAFARTRNACSEHATTTDRAHFFPRMQSGGPAMNAIPLIHCVGVDWLPANDQRGIVEAPCLCRQLPTGLRPRGHSACRAGRAACPAGVPSCSARSSGDASFGKTGREPTQRSPRRQGHDMRCRRRHAEGKPPATGGTRVKRPACIRAGGARIGIGFMNEARSRWLRAGDVRACAARPSTTSQWSSSSSSSA